MLGEPFGPSAASAVRSSFHISVALNPRVNHHVPPSCGDTRATFASKSQPFAMYSSSFVQHAVDLSHDLTINALTSGSGPPLLLLHGFPQNLNIWHLVAPHLTSTYTTVLLDLRGYGLSSKPLAGENHANYSKSAMAQDCVSVMEKLGHEKFYVCGHDRGGRVAHKLCVNHPESVLKAIVLDIAPTLAMYNKTDFAFAKAYWHWFFLIQPHPLPETLLRTNSRGFIENTMGFGEFHPDAIESYVAQIGDEGCVRGVCEDYRAAAGIDLEESREDVEKGRKIRCKFRVLWGKKGVIEKQFDALKEWRAVAEEGLVDGEALGCGHYIPEHAPEDLVRHMREFFKT